MSFRIGSIWAFISAGDDDEEGVIGADIRGVFVPFIAADRVRLDALKKKAIEIACQHSATVRLVRFDLRTDVEVITSDGIVEAAAPGNKRS